MKKLTCEEIINETVDFYAQDPDARRSMDGNDCLFQNSEGARCAMGRCMTEKGIKDVLSEDKNQAYSTDLKNPLDYYLRKRYRGKPLDLWDDLQDLHDTPDNWDEKGLTEHGRVAVAWLLDRTRDLGWK
tara:strand:- start:75 stop:461 length:387 start_codon:yes stop_codon:yes gene_type:complete